MSAVDDAGDESVGPRDRDAAPAGPPEPTADRAARAEATTDANDASAASVAPQRGLLTRWWADTELRLLLMSAMFGLVGGVVMGIIWAAITPSGLAYAQPGYWYAITDAELMARQQFVFAGLGLAMGVLHGLWAAWKLSERPVTQVLWMAFSGYAGSAMAWLVGHLVGPLRHVEPIPDHPQAMVAPLEIQAYGVLLFWPAAACLTMTLVLFVLVAGTIGRDMRRVRHAG